MGSTVVRLTLSACVTLLAGTAYAQAPTPASTPSVSGVPALSCGTPTVTTFMSNQMRLERLSDVRWRMTGQVEIECDTLKFFADEVDVFTDTNRLTARGNVVFSSPEGRISAESVDFDTKRLVGTFTLASGILSLGPKADRSQFGGQDPDVYFYGQQIEKLGEKKYRLTRGAFTTCVQPTPRWEMTSGTATLNLDDYAVLRSTVLRVKGVPLMYLPYAYYPLQQDQRATGFLLPAYGASSLRGQALSNAFFWAMGRSQDATFFHDWFSRTGQGVGTEYRYVAAPGSEGTFRAYLFNQRAADFTTSGTISSLPATRSFELTGSGVQALPFGLRGRARFDYFSNLTTQQLYHGNVFDASRRSRTLGGSASGSWGPYSASAVYQTNEAFEGVGRSVLYGSTPRVSGSLAARPLFGSPAYFAATSEYAYLVYRDQRGSPIRDDSLTRIDVAPSVRVPFSKLTFLTVNSSASYRVTHYSRSADSRERITAGPLTRAYVGLRSDVVGPVFTRIFNTPTNRFAERYKHVIEPTFGIEKVSSIDNYRNVPLLTDTSDRVVGGLTRITYGITNRLLARTHTTEERKGQAREVLTASIQQTYYGSPDAAQFDITYASSNRGNPSNLSPVALTIRASPVATTDATVRIERSVSGDGLQMLSMSGSTEIGASRLSTSWSRRRSDPTQRPDNFFSTSAAVRLREGRVTGNYGLSWDVGRGLLVSQTMRMIYNAQCCGIGFDYQVFNFPQSSAFPIPSDRRINFSFMLAGLGTFQNFFGAFGGPR